MRTAVTISTPASAASGIFDDQATRRRTRPATSTSACTIGGDPGAGTGADVDRRAGDRTGGGHAAEQRRHEVGEALTEELAVGVVASAVGHAVGDLGRQQALDRRRARRPRAPADSSSLIAVERDVGQRRQRQRGRAATPMRADVQRRPAAATTVAATTASSDAGSARCIARRDDHHRRDQHDETDGGDCTCRPSTRRATARTATAAVFSPSGLATPERGGHLLEEDDDGDADGEALDHRPRDVRQDSGRGAEARRRRPARRP